MMIARDVDVALANEITNLLLRLLLARDHVAFALRFRQREVDGKDVETRGQSNLAK